MCVMFLAGCANLTVSDDSHSAWQRTQGSIIKGPLLTRARSALARLTPGIRGVPLTIAVLDTPTPSAYSFPDGSIYISSFLASTLTDDELAAVIAHETGHLLLDHRLQSPAGLRGASLGPDSESRADQLACQVLTAHKIPSTSLLTALQKVADASQGTPYYSSLQSRITRLKSQLCQ